MVPGTGRGTKRSRCSRMTTSPASATTAPTTSICSPQALNLAFSDRHHYYGDPDHVDVPMNGLLSKQYTSARRTAIDMERSVSGDAAAGRPLAVPGRCAIGCGGAASRDPAVRNPGAGHQLHLRRRPVGQRLLGHAQRRRGRWPGHPRGWGSCCRPGARRAGWNTTTPPAYSHGSAPRLTPNPAIAFKQGRLFMPFGAPGGDAQCPAMVQMFLEHRRVRLGTPGGGGAATVHLLELPQLFLASRLSPGTLGRRGHPTAKHDPRAQPPRPRSRGAARCGGGHRLAQGHRGGPGVGRVEGPGPTPGATPTAWAGRGSRWPPARAVSWLIGPRLPCRDGKDQELRRRPACLP